MGSVLVGLFGATESADPVVESSAERSHLSLRKMMQGIQLFLGQRQPGEEHRAGRILKKLTTERCVREETAQGLFDCELAHARLRGPTAERDCPLALAGSSPEAECA